MTKETTPPKADDAQAQHIEDIHEIMTGKRTINQVRDAIRRRELRL